MRLILENRKESAIEKLQKRFEYDKPFIRRVFDLDPTLTGKYATYIEKTLPQYIIGLAGEEGGLAVGYQNRIENIFRNIRWFEINSKYITPKIIDKFLLENPDVENPELIKKSPKDINSYGDPHVITDLKEIIEKNRSDKEKTSVAKSQANKLYEDENFLVVEPMSFVASCYYGKNTKWCVTGNIDGETHFNSYTQKGRVIFFINKNIPQGKIAMYIPKNLSNNKDNIQVWDDNDEGKDLNFLYTNFEPIADFIDELTGYRGTFYRLLIGFYKGKVSAEELKKEEPLIKTIRGLKSENKGSAILVLNFKNDDDYFNILNLEEDDLSFVQRIFNPYYGMELHDSYHAIENWNDGHIYDYMFNEENTKKFDTIVNLIEPQTKKEGGYYPASIFNMIENMFERNVRVIIYEYSDSYNEALIDGNKDYVIDDLGDIFFDYGIHKLNSFYKYFTTVENLIFLYNKFDPTKRKTIEQLLSTITLNIDMSKNYWDNIYEINLGKYFNKEKFNRVAERELDEILEKLEDDEVLSGKVRFVKEVTDKILSKYNMDRIYTLPSDRNVTFQLSNLDSENEKIEVIVKRKGKGAEKNKFTIPEFFQFLNTYPLFK